MSMNNNSSCNSIGKQGGGGGGGGGSEAVLRKGPWMPEEDEILIEYVHQYGPRDWSAIRSKGLLPRTGKSCRLRWVNKLKPDLKRSGCKFTPEEEKLVVEMQAELGNKWAKIASYLPGRTDNDVKNFWSTRQKRLMRALQPTKQQIVSKDSTKDAFFNDISPFQVHSPSGAPQHFLPSHWSSPSPLTEEDSEHQFGEINNINNDNMSGNFDDVFMVKLQGILGNEILFSDTDYSQRGLNLENGKPGCMNNSASHCFSKRSSKGYNSNKSKGYNSRSRREKGFECNFSMDMVGTLQADISFLQSSSYDCGLEIMMQDQFHTLYGGTSNNYPDLRIVETEEENHTMQNEDHRFFSDDQFVASLTNTQWERLPLLYPDETQYCLTDCSSSNNCIKKEKMTPPDSCSPESVLESSSSIICNNDCHLFDSLEPLSSTPSEWWIFNEFNATNNDNSSSNKKSINYNTTASVDNIAIANLVKPEPEFNQSCEAFSENGDVCIL